VWLELQRIINPLRNHSKEPDGGRKVKSLPNTIRPVCMRRLTLRKEYEKLDQKEEEKEEEIMSEEEGVKNRSLTRGKNWGGASLRL